MELSIALRRALKMFFLTGTLILEYAEAYNEWNEAVLNFTCPMEDALFAAAHPRYADPNDCQYFFVCISGVTPRHKGCKFGEVFNSELKACDAPSEVLECEKYYYDYFDEYFTTLGVGSTRLSTEVIQAALASNYPVPQNAKISRQKPRISSTNRKRKPTKDSAPAVALVNERTRPAGNRKRIRRRRPGVRRKKTTTTTTEAPAPEYYYDEYEYPADYYEDIPVGETGATPKSNTPA